MFGFFIIIFFFNRDKKIKSRYKYTITNCTIWSFIAFNVVKSEMRLALTRKLTWGSRGARQVRAAGLGIAVALATTESGRITMTTHCQHVAGGIWGVAFSILLDPDECSLVRQQVRGGGEGDERWGLGVGGGRDGRWEAGERGGGDVRGGGRAVGGGKGTVEGSWGMGQGGCWEGMVA